MGGADSLGETALVAVEIDDGGLDGFELGWVDMPQADQWGLHFYAVAGEREGYSVSPGADGLEGRMGEAWRDGNGGKLE